MKTLLSLFFLLSVVAGVSSQVLYGVAYGIDINNCPSDDQLRNDITLISTFAHRVRVYQCYPCGNICLKIARIAKPLGLQLLLGIQPGPPDAYGWEKGAVSDLANSDVGLDSNIVGVTVGSESLYRGDLTSSQLADIVNDFRSFLRNNLKSNLPVGTADTYFKFDSTIIAACDMLYINLFPYWQGVADPVAGARITLQGYDQVVAVAQGKPVFIGETGWPTGGPAFGDAQATTANQAAFLPALTCQADARGIGYYIYAAFDAHTGGTTTPEDNFGVYTTQRTRKSSFVYTCNGGSQPSNTVPPATPDQCRQMFAGLKCRTLSEDPSQVDSAAVSGARSWLCNANYQFCTTIQPGGQYSTCNSVEQLSYAMNLWYALYSPQQGDAACNFGGIAKVVTAGTPPPTFASTVTPTFTPSTVNQASCQAMYAGLQCRTLSEDPAQIDSAAVTNARNWLCGNFAQYCTDINTGGRYSSCNSVEQMSYAMNLYYAQFSAKEGAGACSFGGIGQVVEGSQPTSTPQPTSSSASCQSMFSGLVCRTPSEDPAQFDSGAIAGARGWLCNAYSKYCTAINSGGQYSGCNSVEQLSYAMNAYYADFQSQGPSACDFGGVAKLYTSTPTQTPPASSTNCRSMFSQLKCRTASENTSDYNADSINGARGWLCGTYPQYCTDISSGAQYSTCNSVEQLSYAMNAYYTDFAPAQGDQACNFGGIGHVYHSRRRSAQRS